MPSDLTSRGQGRDDPVTKPETGEERNHGCGVLEGYLWVVFQERVNNEEMVQSADWMWKGTGYWCL